MFTLTAQPPLFIFKGLGAPAGPGEIFTYAVIDTTLMHRRVLSYLVMWSLPLTRFPLLIIPPFPFPALVCSSHWRTAFKRINLKFAIKHAGQNILTSLSW